MDEPVTPAADESREGEASAPAPTASPAPWRARFKKWLMLGGVAVIVVPIVVLAAWTAITLNYAYSTGYRAGFVQKISKKGWICPTWEGELQMVNLPGAAPEKWTFTVRDDVVATAVQSSIGHSVALEYEEHRGVPTTCFGDTQYFVVGVRQVSAP